MLPPCLMLTIKKQGKLAAILVLAATFLTACGPPGPRALTKGQALLSAGKTTDAVAKFEEAVQLFGADSPQAQAQAFNWLGLAYHQSGQIDKAATAYKEALRLDRKLTTADYNLGCLEFERNNYHDAINYLNTCALARPAEVKEADVYLRLGTAYIRLAAVSSSATDRNRDYDAAKRYLEQSIRLSTSAEAFNELGIVYMYRQRSPKDALPCFQEAIRLQPSFAAAWLNSAVVHQFYLGDRKSAAQEYRAYLQCLPGATNTREVEAQIRDLEKVSNSTVAAAPPQAVAQPKSEVAPPAPSAAAKSSTGRYHYVAGFTPAPGNRQEATRLVAEGTQALQARKISDSSDLFQRAIKADPTYFDAYYYFGAVAREAGNVSASVEALEKALLLRPESAEARYGFAWALQQAHFPQDCANELEKLLKLTPNDTRAHLFLANVYAQELSQAKLARVHYTQVLSAEPNHPQAAAIRHWLGANP
jgi:tetratricopeptide (TPR) repeat protein